MQIKTDNDHLERLHDEECMPEDYDITFSSKNTATVTAEVGEAVIDKYDSIHSDE